MISEFNIYLESLMQADELAELRKKVDLLEEDNRKMREYIREQLKQHDDTCIYGGTEKPETD